MTKDALASGSVGVGINESADCGIVITGLEVVEAGISIVVVAAVAQGIDFSDVRIIAVAMVRSCNNLAVGVILVAGDNIPVGVDDLHHIALQVSDVVIGSAVVLQRIGNTAGIVEEIEGIVAVGLPQ